MIASSSLPGQNRAATARCPVTKSIAALHFKGGSIERTRPKRSPWRWLLLYLVAICSTADAQIATWLNGNFETLGSGGQSAANWTDNQNAGVAAFSLITTTGHNATSQYDQSFFLYQGTYSFEADISNPGTDSSSFPALVHNAIATDNSSTYLVSFMAYSGTVNGKAAGVNRPKMTLHVDTTAGSTTTKQSKTFYPATGDSNYGAWDEYRFSFKAPTGSTVIWFSFEQSAIYYLDNVYLYDQNDPYVDVVTTYLWANGFDNINNGGDPTSASDTCWTGGDGNWAALLPDGRVGWFFADSFMGKIDQSTNLRQSVGSTYPLPDLNPKNDSFWQFNRNFFGVQSADPLASATLTPYLTRQWPDGDPVIEPASFVPPDATTTNGYFYWPADAVAENSNLQVILIEHGGTAGTQIVTLPLSNLRTTPPISGAAPEAPASPAPTAYTAIDFGQNILNAGDGYIYLYDSDKHATKGTSVAQVPYGKLTSETDWKWLQSDGVTFGARPSTLTTIANVAYEGYRIFECLGPDNYATFDCSMYHPLVQFSKSPAGPWTATSKLACPVDPPQQMCNPWYYSTQVHKELWQNGVYSVGYCDNIGDVLVPGTTYPNYEWYTNPEQTNDYKITNGVFPQQQMDRCAYNPHYMKTYNLLKLSPYTLNNYSDQFSNINESSAWWRSYGGTWTSSNGSYGVTLPTSGTSSKGSYSMFKGLAADPAANSISTNGDVTVSASVLCPSTSSGGYAGLIVHGSSFDMGETNFSGYAAVLKPGSVNLLRMDANGTSSGGSTLMVSAHVSNLLQNTYHTVKVVSANDAITVYLDGTVVISNFAGEKYTTGGVGVCTRSSGNQWQNFKVSIP